MVVGAVAQSRAFGLTMGAYGAAVSVYSHFMARGHEVEFPKNTAMQIEIAARAPATPKQDVAPSAAPPGSATLIGTGAETR
jgi:hypothetical protein